MADAKGKKELGLFSNESGYERMSYKFSDDGGAISVINLGECKQDIIISQAYVGVKKAFTDAGGTGTVEIGIAGGDTDAIMPATLVSGLGADTVIDGDAASERLRVPSGSNLAMEIKVEAMTDGELDLHLEYSRM